MNHFKRLAHFSNVSIINQWLAWSLLSTNRLNYLLAQSNYTAIFFLLLFFSANEKRNHKIVFYYYHIPLNILSSVEKIDCEQNLTPKWHTNHTRTYTKRRTDRQKERHIREKNKWFATNRFEDKYEQKFFFFFIKNRFWKFLSSTPIYLQMDWKHEVNSEKRRRE